MQKCRCQGISGIEWWNPFLILQVPFPMPQPTWYSRCNCQHDSCLFLVDQLSVATPKCQHKGRTSFVIL